MNLHEKLRSLLKKTNLSRSEAEFYLFVMNNRGCSVADVCKNTDISKSTAYRAFEKLKSLDLIKSASDFWKSNLQALSLASLIKRLENQQRNRRRLITELKLLNKTSRLSASSKIPGIETFTGDKVYEKYHELSETEFNTNLVFGNWEPFNNKKSIVPVEKQFIKNRMKNGGNSLVLLTQAGPNTHEIIDYDRDENRVSKLVESNYGKPVWINAFEGNNFVYIWNLDNAGNTHATLIESAPVAEFYRNFIWSHAV